MSENTNKTDEQQQQKIVLKGITWQRTGGNVKAIRMKSVVVVVARANIQNVRTKLCNVHSHCISQEKDIYRKVILQRNALCSGAK